MYRKRKKIATAKRDDITFIFYLVIFKYLIYSFYCGVWFRRLFN